MSNDAQSAHDELNTPPALESLRTQLGSIDRRILQLIAKRQSVAIQIGVAKRDAGLPTRNYQQERDVLQRARAAADEFGLAPSLVEDILLTLIRGSLTVQERDMVSARRDGSGRRVLVIGGLGNMGRWCGHFLTAQGFQVETADPGMVALLGERATVTPQGWPIVSDYRTLKLDHEMIIIAAPMPITATILLDLATSPPPGIVFDVGSLKSPLRASLKALRDAGGRVTSIHPMFGPDTELMSGRHVILVDVGVPEATAAARALFEPTMATLVEMDLESHDRLIAYVLGLSHAVNIAFFTALADSGEGAKRLAQLSSTTFDAQLGVASRVAKENPDLYFEIQQLNDYGTESLSALLYAVERLRSVVRAGDVEGFRHLMERGRDYLAQRPG
jgi:chorismate mutase / prephenate dehydrogenase